MTPAPPADPPPWDERLRDELVDAARRRIADEAGHDAEQEPEGPARRA